MMVFKDNKRTPQHIIETRTEHIAELKRFIARFSVVQNEFYLDKTEAEIRDCESEIRYAKYRINLGLNDPY